MKVSFMTFACPQWSLDQITAAAARYGYHGVEIRLDSGHAHGVEIAADKSRRADARRRFADAGLDICCLASSLRFIDPAAPRDALPRIQLAADLACPGLRVFCGPLPAGTDIASAIPIVADHLRQAADAARAAGVELWLETHDSICRADHAAAIVLRADHPAVRLNYDVLHPHRVGEPLATTLECIAPFVRHTHWHDGGNRDGQMFLVPFDQGSVPLEAALRGLASLGFDGYLSGEWFDTQYGPTPDASLQRFRRDVTDLARLCNLHL